MEQGILTAEQEQVIALVSSDASLESFYLSGGTALAAFYLHHRLSDDLDFFTEQPVDITTIRTFVDRVKETIHATTVRFEKVHDRNIFFFGWENGKELKVEFTEYPFHPLESPLAHDGLRVDSLRDIAANKLMAMLDRFDPKDFVDLYLLIKQHSLHDIRLDAEKKFNVALEAAFIGSELTKVSRIEALPAMLISIAVTDLKKFFEEQIRLLKPEVIEE